MQKKSSKINLRNLGCKNVIITEVGTELTQYLIIMKYISMRQKLEQIDINGAGDAFNGAFAFGLSKGLSAKDALKLSIFVGSLSTTKKGCQTKANANIK